MERISRDDMLMSVAYIVALRGTCSRLQVGAVVSRDGRIIATGYNGSPRGLPHCDHSEGVASIDGVNVSDSGCSIAEHSERNAIYFAARHGLGLERSEIHVTHAPCAACARAIINAGIVRVSFSVPYRLTEGVELLARAGIDVVDMGIPPMVGYKHG